jgi:hypothetical protein
MLIAGPGSGFFSIPNTGSGVKKASGLGLGSATPEITSKYQENPLSIGLVSGGKINFEEVRGH